MGKTSNLNSLEFEGFPHVTLYVSEGSLCNPGQTKFTRVHPCKNQRDFLLATMYDYTNIRFKEGRRLGDNFVSADCLVGDVDNTHTDDPHQWLEPIDVAERLHGVPIFYQYSRNHMKEKNGKSARPKFHFVVPIAPVDTPDGYKLQWRLLKAVVPEIDPATKDLARFTFGGGRTNQGGIFQGDVTLTEFCEINDIEPVPEDIYGVNFGYSSSAAHIGSGEEFEDGYIIYDGERTRTLLRLARRYYSSYLSFPNRDEMVWNNMICLAENHCSPPFPMAELQRVLNSAKGYAEKERAKWLSILNRSEEE